MHAAPAATKQLQYTYRALAVIAAFCWITGAADASRGTDRLTLAAAIASTLSAVLLWGVHMILRRHENTTLLVLGALADEITRKPGGGAPTGPFPVAVPFRQRGAA